MMSDAGRFTPGLSAVNVGTFHFVILPGKIPALASLVSLSAWADRLIVHFHASLFGVVVRPSRLESVGQGRSVSSQVTAARHCWRSGVGCCRVAEW